MSEFKHTYTNTNKSHLHPVNIYKSVNKSMRLSVCHVSNCKYLWLFFYFLSFSLFIVFFIIFFYLFIYFMSFIHFLFFKCCCSYFCIGNKKLNLQQNRQQRQHFSSNSNEKKIYNFLSCLIMSNRQQKGNLFNIFISFLSTHLQLNTDTPTQTLAITVNTHTYILFESSHTLHMDKHTSIGHT